MDGDVILAHDPPLVRPWFCTPEFKSLQPQSAVGGLDRGIRLPDDRVFVPAETHVYGAQQAKNFGVFVCTFARIALITPRYCCFWLRARIR